MKKKIVAIMMALTMVIGSNSLAYAEESDGCTWVQEGEVWKLKDNAGNVKTNVWYQDGEGNRYYLDVKGVMQTGLVNDNGHYYYLDDSGKMVVTDGVYNGVNLTFNKDASSATYGEILSGVQDLQNQGVQAHNTGAVNVSTNSTQNTQQQNTNAPVDGQLMTRQDGSVYQWNASMGMWVCVQAEMNQADDYSSTWNDEAAELAREVGRNMAH